jgi:hypothetical protein
MGMTTEHKELYKAIDEILWNDWDPIGLNGLGPRDEYEGYANNIFSLKIKGADQETIAQKLYEIETITIGLSGDRSRCVSVAEKVISLK